MHATLLTFVWSRFRECTVMVPYRMLMCSLCLCFEATLSAASVCEMTRDWWHSVSQQQRHWSIEQWNYIGPESCMCVCVSTYVFVRREREREREREEGWGSKGEREKVCLWPFKALIVANYLCSFEPWHVDVRNGPLVVISEMPSASVITAVNESQDRKFENRMFWSSYKSIKPHNIVNTHTHT